MPRTQPGTGQSAPPAGRRAAGRPAPPQPVTVAQLWGTRPGRFGVFAVLAATLLGMVITLLSGSEPGLILGIFVVAGSLAAATAVRPGAGYLIFPVPAPAYAVAAVIAGLVHDRATDTSRTALALSAAQWLAGGFIAMIVATAVAVLVIGYRWLRSAGSAESATTQTLRPGPPR